MSFLFPSTIDEPELYAVMPDWQAGVQQETTYRTEITRSRSGLEQRAQRRRRPILSMTYQVSLKSPATRLAIETTVATNRLPVIVPWWPNGRILAEAMASSTIATLEGEPIKEDWSATTLWAYLFDPTTSEGEWREFGSVAGAELTLINTGSHTLFPEGAFIFPGRLSTREPDNMMLQKIRPQEGTETLRFRTL
jgi:hypothetical protein